MQIPALLREQQLIASLGGPKPRRLRKPRRQKFPKGVERTYRATMLLLVEQLTKDIEETLVSQLPNIQRLIDNRTDVQRADAGDWTSVIEAALAALNLKSSQTIEAQRTAARARETAEALSRFNRIQVARQLKAAIGVDVIGTETGIQDYLADWVRENTALIESIPQNLHDRIGQIVRSEFRQGQRAEVVEEKIRKVFGVTRNRAILIARDQSNKLTGQLTRLRQTSLGIESYRWRTSNDDRVRPTHAANDGKVFQWNDPPAETGHPGHDVNCRCTAEPVFDDLF